MLSSNKQTHRVNDLNILFSNSTFVITHNFKTTSHYGYISLILEDVYLTNLQVTFDANKMVKT